LKVYGKRLAFDAWKAYPQLEIMFLSISPAGTALSDDGAYVMNEMLEKAKVKMLYRTFVDTILNHNAKRR
jgi:hypothetical protein